MAQIHDFLMTDEVERVDRIYHWRLDEEEYRPTTITRSKYESVNPPRQRPLTKTEELHGVKPGLVYDTW